MPLNIFAPSSILDVGLKLPHSIKNLLTLTKEILKGKSRLLCIVTLKQPHKYIMAFKATQQHYILKPVYRSKVQLIVPFIIFVPTILYY